MIDKRSTKAYKLEKENKKLKERIKDLEEKLENSDYWWYERQCKLLERENKELKELFEAETEGDKILRKMILSERRRQKKDFKIKPRNVDVPV